MLQSLELKDSIHSIYDLKEQVLTFASISHFKKSSIRKFFKIFWKARSPYYVPDLPSLHSELPGSPSLIQPILEEDNRPPAWRLDRRSTLTSSIDVNTSCTDGNDICLDVSWKLRFDNQKNLLKSIAYFLKDLHSQKDRHSYNIKDMEPYFWRIFSHGKTFDSSN